jgi:hypothetical protein
LGSRTKDQLEALGHRERLRISNVAKIMETTAGEERKGREACSRCQERGLNAGLTQIKLGSMSSSQLKSVLVAEWYLWAVHYPVLALGKFWSGSLEKL